MNPLTQVKNLQKITARESASGIAESASWHAEYKDSAYIFFGGLAYELNEGDILAVFAQYGEVVDVNLIRDKGTGKSKGYGFLAYEDQRSTTLAVDNLNGAQVAGRTLRVDHVRKYRKKEEEDEEERQKKREENGVCYEFQRGSCSRGDSCKFSHDENRNKNTGWGADDETKWKHDRHDESRGERHRLESRKRSPRRESRVDDDGRRLRDNDRRR
ncbi:zinc finger CCCH domain-containing protein 25 [Selaginella moellendorffii]|nr:zinc finger CCCH domain-containing protein 25 [Selaginella moellendorffii]|eukprot:XP_002979026.2 zinc finger CCCH domain-containing protein 25 [Selaginella moellendorffii]